MLKNRSLHETSSMNYANIDLTTLTMKQDLITISGNIPQKRLSLFKDILGDFDGAGAFWSMGSHARTTFFVPDTGQMSAGAYRPVSSTPVKTVKIDITAPTVTSFSPADGSTGAPINSTIVLTFSETIQRGTGIIAIHSGSSTGSVVESFNAAGSSHLNFSGSKLTIDPTSNLSNNTQYFITFEAGTVRDLAGNSYAGTTGYDFITTSDSTAPKAVAFSPADGSTGSAINSNIVCTFSEAIYRGTGIIAIHSGSPTGNIVENFDAASSSHLIFSGNMLTIDPTSDFSNNTQYFITFDAGTVKDLAGNSYAGSTNYDFRTETDTSLPTVVAFTPTDGSTGVAVGSNILLTFSETIQRGTGTISIHSGSPTGPTVENFNAADSTHLTFSGNTLTIDPTSDLSSNTQYFLTFDAGTVKDLAGNSYAGSTNYDFNTARSTASWDLWSGHGLLNIDGMLERATGKTIADASLYGDGWGTVDWGLNMIQAPDAWNAGYTGKGVIVAIIDTGVNYLHSDLSRNIWKNSAEIQGNSIDDDHNGYIDDIYGYDFINNDGYALDDNGHGSHIAGTIAGLRNGTGVTGVAYDAQIMPVKVLSSIGTGSDGGVADGIDYAVANGADVINLSLGGGFSYKIALALQNAINHGVLVCMAAGNAAQYKPTYPAYLAQSYGGIAVGAVNNSDTLAYFSNGTGYGASYDFVVAPGVNVYSTSNIGNAYMVNSGTSMATPYVAGAAALLLSAHGDFLTDWSVEQLENCLSMAASPLASSGLLFPAVASAGVSMQSMETLVDDFMNAYTITIPEPDQICLVGIAA